MLVTGVYTKLMPALQPKTMRASLVVHELELEDEFQTKLHRSWIADCGDHAKVRGRDVSRERSEVRVIENIERLGTNLSREPFGKPQVLRHRKVNAVRRRSLNNAARGSSWRIRQTDGGVRGIQLEALVRDPLYTVRGILIRIAKQIRTSGGVGVNQPEPGSIEI